MTQLDVEQARTQLLNTLASIPPLETQRRQAQDALSVLLGMPPSDLGDLLDGLFRDPRLTAPGHRGHPGRPVAPQTGCPERRAAGRRSIRPDRSGQGRSLSGLHPGRQPGLPIDGSGDVQAQRHVPVGEPLDPGRSLRAVEHPQLRPDHEQRPRAGCVLPAVPHRVPECGALGPEGRRGQPDRVPPRAGSGGSAGPERHLRRRRRSTSPSCSTGKA